MSNYFRILVCTAALVSGCSSHRVSSVTYPLIVPGTSIDGIKGSFEIIQYSAETTEFYGNVVLRNPAAETRSFRIFDLFYLHISVRDHSGKEVPTSDSVGAVNPTTEKYHVEPGGMLKIPFRLRIRDFFKVSFGDYSLKFIYDVRLIRQAKFGEDPFLPWSDQVFPFRVHS